MAALDCAHARIRAVVGPAFFCCGSATAPGSLPLADSGLRWGNGAASTAFELLGEIVLGTGPRARAAEMMPKMTEVLPVPGGPCRELQDRFRSGNLEAQTVHGNHTSMAWEDLCVIQHSSTALMVYAEAQAHLYERERRLFVCRSTCCHSSLLRGVVLSLQGLSQASRQATSCE